MVWSGLNETEYQIQGRYTFKEDYDPVDDPEKVNWSEWSNLVVFRAGNLPVSCLYCFSFITLFHKRCDTPEAKYSRNTYRVATALLKSSFLEKTKVLYSPLES